MIVKVFKRPDGHCSAEHFGLESDWEIGAVWLDGQARHLASLGNNDYACALAIYLNFVLRGKGVRKKERDAFIVKAVGGMVVT